MRVLTVGLVVLIGCGGVEVVDVDAATGASDGACAVVDAGNCAIARRSLECGGHGCLTNGDVCPSTDAGCVDQCEAGEYAAWCGAGPTERNAPPSADCRAVAWLPSGTIIYCCSCAE